MDVDLKTLRLLDANLNRAREGLRVVEDTARFIWNDPKLYRALRSARHRLHEVTAGYYKSFVQSRDSIDDAGRLVKEGGRSSIGAVVSANFRRAEEAVRVMEEYSKVFGPRKAKNLKELRYQLYSLEKKILDHV